MQNFEILPAKASSTEFGLSIHLREDRAIAGSKGKTHNDKSQDARTNTVRSTPVCNFILRNGFSLEAFLPELEIFPLSSNTSR
jgi:hypothetical protein